jgi:hypothetical protein
MTTDTFMLTLVGDGYKQDININYVVYFGESYLLFFHVRLNNTK